jgi:hypothetical protein
MDASDDHEPTDGAPGESSETPESDERRRVREKLRELYGDDSADAVRRLFSEILSEEEDEGEPN